MTSSKTNGQKLVSLSELLAQSLPFEDVAVDEYGPGTTIRLNAVTGLERARLADLQAQEDQSLGERLSFQHELIAASLGAGATAEQVAGLPSQVIDKLAAVALRLAGIGKDAEKQAEQDLGDAQTGASG